MNSKAKSITLEGIAKLAGVSTASVSRALNNSDLIKDETKKRIIEIANKQHYALNYGAQSLSRQKSNTMALFILTSSARAESIAPVIKEPFFLKVLSGLMSQISILNCELVINRFESGKHDKVYQAIRSKKVDGVIVYGDTAQNWKNDRALIGRIPVVFWGGEAGDNFYTVATNDFLGGELAAQKLLSSGVTNFAFIGANTESFESQQRLSGFRSYLSKHNISLNEDSVSFAQCFSSSGADQMTNILLKDNSINGVFACCDELALTAMKVIQSHGLNIPEQVKVIGYDNIASGATSTPTLTTISRDGYDAGRMLVNKLLGVIGSKDEHVEDRPLTITLIERGSC